MADTVSVSWIYPPNWDGNPPVDGKSGWRTVQVALQGVSDGTGESLVKKVDISTLRGPGGFVPTRMVVKSILWDVAGMVVSLHFQRTPNVKFATLTSQGFMDCMTFVDPGGSGVGETGDILLSTTGHTSGDSYYIFITMQLKSD